MILVPGSAKRNFQARLLSASSTTAAPAQQPHQRPRLGFSEVSVRPEVPDVQDRALVRPAKTGDCECRDPITASPLNRELAVCLPRVQTFNQICIQQPGLLPLTKTIRKLCCEMK